MNHLEQRSSALETALQTIRHRRIDLLTGGAALDPAQPLEGAALVSLDARVTALLTAGAPTFTEELRLSWVILGGIRDAAVAWATPASIHHRSAAVHTLCTTAVLDWAAVCGAESPQLGNWWHWEIGVPHVLTDLGLLLGEALDTEVLAVIDAFVERFAPDPNWRTKIPTLAETGANRADKAAIALKHGALIGSRDKVAAARDALFDLAGGGQHSLFAYVEDGDGMYRDGSYIQHDKLAYAGAYGLVTLAELADLLFLLAGTPWEVDSAAAAPFLEFVERGYSPFITDGFMMDCTRGRGVSRSFATDAHMGAVAAGSIARLAAVVPPGHPCAGTFRSLVKGWLERNPNLPLTHLPLDRVVLLRALKTDDGVAAAAPLVGHVQTADQERVLHRRPRWQASISLSSHRRGRFEWGNGENLHGWHQGDGQVQLFTDTDRGAYSGSYWATSDPLHLPGVTNVVREGAFREEPGTGIPAATASWAGGAGWGSATGGAHMFVQGSAGMDLENAADGLAGVKSWFCLDDRYVALGAGITGTHGHSVHTTIEARRLQDPDTTFRLEHAAPATAAWAHLEGVAGYVMLDGPGLQHGKERRSGAWQDINVDGSPETLTDNYALMYLDHGIDPANASYAYAVYPCATAGQMPALAASQDFAIPANTKNLQAIEIRAEGMVMANFFAPGTLTTTTLGEVTVDGPAAVVLSFDGKLLRMNVSDPSHDGAPRNVTFTRGTAELVAAPEGSRLQPMGVSVPTAGSRGHTLQVVLRLL